MNAKLTWQSLPEETRKLIELQARMLLASEGRVNMIGDHLLRASGDDMTRRMNELTEFEKYSLYSMAMIEALITPKIREENWDPPRNPFVLRITTADVEKASRHFKVKYGVNVTIAL
jgi:hypothetical protein